MKIFILFIIFLSFIVKAYATTVVLGYPSGSPVNVCIPSDKDSNCGGGGSMVYPGSGVANSTGSAWGISYSVTGNGSAIALTTGSFISGNLRQSDINGNDQDSGLSTISMQNTLFMQVMNNQGGQQ